MCKRMIATLLAIGMVFLNMPAAFAVPIVTVELDATATVPVIGPPGGGTMTVTVVANIAQAGETLPNPGNGTIQFGPTVADLTARGDEIIKINFTADNNLAVFKSVLIYTDNTNMDPPLTSTTSDYPAGLVNQDMPGLTAPILWTVFENLTDLPGGPTTDGATSWVFLADGEGGLPPGPEPVNTRIQAYVSDWAGTPGNPFDSGFASVLIGLVGTNGSLANFPYDDGRVPTDPNNTTDNRVIANGEAYVSMISNFIGAASGDYATNKLTIEMINNL